MGRFLKKAGAAVLVALLLCLALWAGIRYLQQDYVFWNGTLLSRDAQSLDISGRPMGNPETFLEIPGLRFLDARDTGMTLEQYRWFESELPRCSVRWDVPIQGRFYPQDTTELAVNALTPEEIDALAYLPALTLLDVGDWPDLDRIQTVVDRYPGCTVRCRVRLAGEVWDSDAVSLILKDADAQELSRRLSLFHKLQSVMLTGKVPRLTELKALQEQFPDIFFLWKMESFGQTLETDMTELDLSGARLVSVSQLEELLSYFPLLETVTLDSSDLDPRTVADLARRYPGVRFLLDVTIGDHTLRTDAQEIDISNTPFENTSEVEALLPCFHDLQKVVMCNCGISDEDMDALNKKYPDIRFVWSVNLAGMEFRTDAVHFTPNRWGLKVTDENIYALRYCTDMVCVDVGHGSMLTNCEWVRFMPKLKYLILAETGITDLTPLENHENLIFLELFLCKARDFSPLVTLKNLEDLNLCYTGHDWEPIAEMTWLKRLWWTGSWLARTNLADKLPNTYAEYLSPSSTGKGWREGQNYYDMRDFIGMDYMKG